MQYFNEEVLSSLNQVKEVFHRKKIQSNECKIRENFVFSTKSDSNKFITDNLSCETLSEIRRLVETFADESTHKVKISSIFGCFNRKSSFKEIYSFSFETTLLNEEELRLIISITSILFKNDDKEDNEKDDDGLLDKNIDEVIKNYRTFPIKNSEKLKDAVVQTTSETIDRQCQCDLLKANRCSFSLMEFPEKKKLKLHSNEVLPTLSRKNHIGLETSASTIKKDNLFDDEEKVLEGTNTKQQIKTKPGVRVGLSKRFKSRFLHSKVLN